MKKRILITLFAALLFSFSISAQILKGHVYDATTNEPLAGASVTYKLKDTQGVVTDINGAYEVHLPAGGVDLVFSYVGYEDVPMPIVISKGDITDLRTVYSGLLAIDPYERFKNKNS